MEGMQRTPACYIPLKKAPPSIASAGLLAALPRASSSGKGASLVRAQKTTTNDTAIVELCGTQLESRDSLKIQPVVALGQWAHASKLRAF